MAFLAPLPSEREPQLDQGLFDKLVSALTGRFPGSEALIGGPLALLGQARRISVLPSLLPIEKLNKLISPASLERMSALSFHEQAFPAVIKVRVELPGQIPFFDEIKGLNTGHALERAAANWPFASRIQIVGMGKP